MFAVIFSSCSWTIDCEDGVIEFSPVGFAKADLDAAYAVRYRQNDTFDSVADSTHHAYYYNVAYDTGKLRIVSEGSGTRADNLFFIPGYDYRIFLPRVGKILTITKIVQQGNKTQYYSQGLFEKTLVSCTNSIISCELNGTPLSSTPDRQSMQVYVVK